MLNNNEILLFSVERLFYDLMKSGHPALDPLVITPNGLLSINDAILESPQQLCTMLHGHRQVLIMMTNQDD